jgi:hypothetical protein
MRDEPYGKCWAHVWKTSEITKSTYQDRCPALAVTPYGLCSDCHKEVTGKEPVLDQEPRWTPFEELVKDWYE